MALALASGLILGSIGALVPVIAQGGNMTGGNMTGGNMTGNQTGNQSGGGNPLENVPIIGDILGGGK